MTTWADDLAEVMRTAVGRRLVRHLIEAQCYVHTNDEVASAAAYTRAGRRAIGLEYFNTAREKCPELLVLADQEHAIAQARARAERERQAQES